MNSTLLLSADFVLGIGLGVALGVGLGMVIAFRRVQSAINASPWETPRTPFIAALRREGERVAHDFADEERASRPQDRAIAPVALLDSLTMWSGVALFEHGARVMPDGTRVGYSEAVRIATEGLRAACVALHDAADLLRHFAQTLPYQLHRELRSRNMDAVICVERALGFDQADAILEAARREHSLVSETEASAAGQGDLWVAQ